MILVSGTETKVLFRYLRRNLRNFFFRNRNFFFKIFQFSIEQNNLVEKVCSLLFDKVWLKTLYWFTMRYMIEQAHKPNEFSSLELALFVFFLSLFCILLCQIGGQPGCPSSEITDSIQFIWVNTFTNNLTFVSLSI